MAARKRLRAHFDTDRMFLDMAERGLEPKDVAARAGLAYSTVSRFLTGDVQTVKTARLIASALGRSHRRYLLGLTRKAA